MTLITSVLLSCNLIVGTNRVDLDSCKYVEEERRREREERVLILDRQERDRESNKEITIRIER